MGRYACLRGLSDQSNTFGFRWGWPQTAIGPERTVFAGRLANYLYIDMDDCMRQALDAAEGEVLPALRAS